MHHETLRFAAILALALPVAAAGSPSGATEETAVDTASMQGEIVDIACYFRHDSSGPEHTKCAVYCANLGMPLAFLEEETGNLFVVLPSGHADPKEVVLPHLGQAVSVEGILWSSGGLTGIEIMEIQPAGEAGADPAEGEMEGGHSEH